MREIKKNWTVTGDVGDAEDNPHWNYCDGSWEERLGNTPCLPLNNSHAAVDAVVVVAVVVVVVVAVLGSLLL